jgi:predicted RNA-binding protein with PIN domain
VTDFETNKSGRSQASPADWRRFARGAFETLTIVGCYAASGLAWAAIAGNSGSDPARLGDTWDPTIYAADVTDESPSSSRPTTATTVAQPPSSTSALPLQPPQPPQAPQAPEALAAHLTDAASGPADAARSATPAWRKTWLIDGFNVLHAGLLGGRDRSKWWTESKRQELLARVASFEDTDAELWIVFDGRREAPESPDGSRTHCVFAPSADTWLVERVRDAADPATTVVVTADRQVAGRAHSRGAQVVSPRDFLARCPV